MVERKGFCGNRRTFPLSTLVFLNFRTCNGHHTPPAGLDDLPCGLGSTLGEPLCLTSKTLGFAHSCFGNHSAGTSTGQQTPYTVWYPPASLSADDDAILRALALDFGASRTDTIDGAASSGLSDRRTVSTLSAGQPRGARTVCFIIKSPRRPRALCSPRV